MERYRYDEKELRFIEESCVPFAVYQYINKRVVTIALSQGFCDLLGYSRQEAVDLMDNNMYRDTHPEDVTYVNDAATRFINEGGEYNTIYRSLKDGEYRIVHAYGRHITKEDGTRLAIIWYNDEGPFSDTSEGRTSQFNQSLSKAIGERNLYKKSNFDYATGLPGMSYFFDLAEQGRRVLLTLGEKVAILYIDLSGMKEFNMQYGFAEGDLLIRSFAKALVKQFTNTNCSHFSADHFAVYTKADGLEKKLDALFADCMTLNAGRNLTVRVGVYIDELGTVPISAACDRAKIASDTGKDVRSSQAYYFDYSMVEQLEKQQYVRDHIDKAIEENWIEVYFQPIVRAANDKVCEEECLVRWNDPENGFMSPADFIPILKEQNTIYKLDLHVVELALEKLKDLSGKGYPMVPQSINLAKEDFYACDMVEEIKKRVDAAGIEREYLTIEIAEDTISGDMDFMQKQVERFREQGFSVWLDDYGSGNASPTVLQKIHFDLVKFDITFIHQIEDKDTSGKIVLAELVKMLMALHMDTVAEGVETEEQVEFLKEIGCTKLQGRYYANAIPLEEIYERNRKGIQIGFENPAEVDYYEAMGRVNLYDFAMTKNDDASLKNYFDTMPMVIYEVGEESLRVVRANKSYRDFVGRAFRRVAGKTEFVFDEYKEGAWGNALKAVRHCAKDGKRAILEERTLNGDVIQLFIRRIAVNPVSGVAAVTAIVLSYMDKKTATSSLTYTHVARALSEDYIYLYYVDMDNNSFVEYGSDNDFGDLPLERLGDNFFEYALEKANADVIDMDNFREVFTKENIQKNIENNGAFNLTYQLMLNGVPTYVNLKALPIKTTGNHIIIGVNNVDAQMRQRSSLILS